MSWRGTPRVELHAATPGIWPRLAAALSPPVGLIFVALGGAKLDGQDWIARRFVEWAFPDAFLRLAGAVEVGLGLMLFFGPARRFGAAGLVVWMTGAVWTHVRAGEAGAAAVPAGLLLFFAAGAVHEFRRHAWTLPVPPAPLRAPPTDPLGRALFAAQLVGVSFLTRWAVGGSLFWSALPVLAVGHAWREGATRDARRLVDLVLLYVLVLGVGVGSLYGFVGHYFMSDAVAVSVGWATGSPFQRELAFYHLGFGISGVLALWLRDDFWLAVGLTCSIFLYGAGWVHLTDYLAHGNAAPNNWGFGVVFGNVVLPTVMLSFLVVRARLRRRDPSSAAGPPHATGRPSV
jgi:uncharacterized membrane protein YphA (DoxX/SURF4 family)